MSALADVVRFHIHMPMISQGNSRQNAAPLRGDRALRFGEIELLVGYATLMLGVSALACIAPRSERCECSQRRH